MPGYPTLSIIIMSYNYGQYIAGTIYSILGQSFEDFELIISDDGSNDNSIDVINSIKDPRITLIRSTENTGAQANYRRAYERCRGEYICSIDADDYISPDMLQKCIEFLTLHPDFDIVGTWITEIDKEGNLHETSVTNWFNQVVDLNDPGSWIWQNKLCHSSAVVRKALHDMVGMLNNDLVHTPDYEFWIRCLVNRAKFHVIPEKLTFYRVHKGNITHKDPERQYWEFAFISARLLHPFLLKIKRPDLIHRNVGEFIKHRLYDTFSESERDNLLALLLTPPAEPIFFNEIYQRQHNPSGKNLYGHEIQRITINGLIQDLRQEREYSRELRSWIGELEKGKAWIEEQWRSSEREAEKLRLEIDVHIKEKDMLVTEKDDLVKQLERAGDELAQIKGSFLFKVYPCTQNMLSRLRSISGFFRS